MPSKIVEQILVTQAATVTRRNTSSSVININAVYVRSFTNKQHIYIYMHVHMYLKLVTVLLQLLK
jgi:hypothetical protein